MRLKCGRQSSRVRGGIINKKQHSDDLTFSLLIKKNKLYTSYYIYLIHNELFLQFVSNLNRFVLLEIVYFLHLSHIRNGLFGLLGIWLFRSLVLGRCWGSVGRPKMMNIIFKYDVFLL